MKVTDTLADKKTRELSALTKDQFTCYQSGLRAARAYENEEKNLVENLIEAEALGLPKAFKLSSLFKHAVKILGLTENVTGMTINVARKSQQMPQLRAAIQSKQVRVSKAHKFCSSVNESNVQDWIEFSTKHSAREIEDRARENDPNRTKSHKFKLSLNAEKLLKRVQSLESQRQGRPVSKEEALEMALDFFVDKRDPVRRADRVIQKVKAKTEKKTPQNSQQFTGIASKLESQDAKSSRRPLTAAQRNAVLARTRGCCTYVNNRGERCNEDRWIDVHHLKPISAGGTNDIENLTVLCGFHHDLVHQLELPFEGENSSRFGAANISTKRRPEIIACTS